MHYAITLKNTKSISKLIKFLTDYTVRGYLLSESSMTNVINFFFVTDVTHY